jgi:hypothetical protein
MPAITENLFIDEIAKGQFSGSAKCDLEIDEDLGQVSIRTTFNLRSAEGSETIVATHKAQINSPIELSVLITYVTTKYGLCLIGKVSADTIKEFYLAYQETERPQGARRQELIRSFGSKLKKRGVNIRASFVGSVVGCAVVFLPEIVRPK